MIRALVRSAARFALLGAALFLFTGPLLAQATGNVQGRVTDAATGRALEGVQVFLEGRRVPIATDAEGRYLITEVPSGRATVRVRLIGYGTVAQELTVAAVQTATADFELTRAVIQLDQIVVTGTGREVAQRRLAATVDVVTPEEIEASPVTDVAELLQGKIAGAMVNATSAQGGTSGLVNFRGVTSVFGSQTPVIYVDGIRVDRGVLGAGRPPGQRHRAGRGHQGGCREHALRVRCILWRDPDIH
jgi:hypothetical protein